MMYQEELKRLLNYDKETGVFTWINSPARSVKSGAIAGVNDKGYIRIGIKGKLYFAHNLAWLYVYGEFPVNILDHKNRIKNDNRICNLREASFSENARNRDKQKDNKTGFKGVTFRSDKGKFRAYAFIDRKQKHLGYFDSAELAHKEYLKCVTEHHGEFCFNNQNPEFFVKKGKEQWMINKYLSV